VLESFFTGVVLLLAIVGAFALFLRLTRSIGRIALSAAEATAAAGLAEVSARRGDITEMSERAAAARRARGARRRDLTLAVVWSLWLVLPLVLGLSPEAYAVAAPLWILPSVRGRG
jgi:hypothetical protein